MRSSHWKVFWYYDCSSIIPDVICCLQLSQKSMQSSVRSSLLQKIWNLFTSVSYVWLKQISVRRAPVNGCFQICIFYCVLVRFSEKYSILAVIYLFTSTSTSCEISSNLVKTILVFLIFLFTWSQFHFAFLYFLLNTNW